MTMWTFWNILRTPIRALSLLSLFRTYREYSRLEAAYPKWREYRVRQGLSPGPWLRREPLKVRTRWPDKAWLPRPEWVQSPEALRDHLASQQALLEWEQRRMRGLRSSRAH